MSLRVRVATFAAVASGSLSLDIATKAIAHGSFVGNYTRMPAFLIIAVAFLLVILGVSHSTVVAIGAGLMLGGLVGNGGQFLIEGYASDWIPIGSWLTNVADLCGAIGFVCCCVGYIGPVIRDVSIVRHQID